MIKSDGSFATFLSRPIAATLAVMTFAVWLWPLARKMMRRDPAPA
jgi:TctA family transporter